MGEIKSVKVDNWGVFFLQKLQNFFNKTDYCDMTLQFNDNSQLKVHRLVLSACTDYFNLLETNCELIDDALVMPNDLQADVVVPIVNFMYTGTLEFELNMYNKLLRTARDMNMTVLLKLLEAHRRTMEQSTQIAKPQFQQPAQARGRATYTSTISPTKQVTIQRGVSTQAPGGRIITSSVNRRPVPTPRGGLVIKEETIYEPSPFEQLRQSGVNYKRPASKAYETPPEKKPSIEDVKEFAEQQRMRKQLAAADVSGVSAEDEYVESYMEDEFPNDDEDEELNIAGSQITIKQEPNQKPTIVFKASADSKMDHAKIIGEVLKKYPHLIKNNKNLKLKIMPNSGPSQQPQQKVVTRKEEVVEVTQQKIVQPAARTITQPTQTVQKPPAGQPKKIDSKTMHSLIALGAENTTGPWLCLRCGVNGRPISIPSYRGFRRHLINTHREKIDPRLCEHCGYRSTDIRDMHFHVQVEHQITSTAFTFPRCEYCSQFFVTTSLLNKHIEESHTKNQQCIYCNEVYPKENDLYNHMKVAHKKQAQNDGVIDFSDAEEVEDENEFLTFNRTEDKKIKILSDISLPTTSVAVNENTKFVAADGTEMVLSDEQREQLMAQLDPNQEGGGIIMVLNESFSVPADQQVEETSVDQSVAIQQEQVQEQQLEVKQEDENMFVYKEVSAEEDHSENKLDESVDDVLDGMDQEEKDQEQVENEEKNETSEQEEKHEDPSNSEDAKNLDEKLKMITGEWSDEEPDEEEPQPLNDNKTTEENILDEKPNQTEKPDNIEEKPDESLETEEKVKEELTENSELASPLKQELMDILGMENIDESDVENKIKEDETKNSKVQEEIQQNILEEEEKTIETEVKSVEEKTTEEEVEDELAQLREEMEKAEKENADNEKEEEVLGEEKESDESNQPEKEVVTETTAEIQGSNTTSEVVEEEKGSEEKAEPEQSQSKDALKSIITDWSEDGEGHDDDL